MANSKNQPLSSWGYYGYDLLYALPVIGLIAMLINSSQSARPDLRNYTRSKFIPFFIWGMLIILALGFAAVIYVSRGFTW